MNKDNWLKKTIRGIEYGLLGILLAGLVSSGIFGIFVYPYLVFFLNWFNGTFTYYYNDGTYSTILNPFMVIAFIFQAFIIVISVFIGLSALHDYAHNLNSAQAQEVEHGQPTQDSRTP